MDYKIWDHDYGQAWRRQQPDYWRQYRRKKRTKPRAKLGLQLLLDALLHAYQGAKKEQLTATKSENKSENTHAKKEQLTNDFYLLKAKDLVFWRLDVAKKEQLAYCFNFN